MSNKLGQNLAYGRNITKNPTNTISAYGDIWRYGGEKKQPRKKTQLAEMHMSSEVVGYMNCLLELCPMSILRKIKNGK